MITVKSFLSKSLSSAAFLLLMLTAAYGQEPAQSKPQDDQFGTYKPNAGFRLATTDKGTVNFRVYTYLRYLNQKGIDSTYTNSFGQTSSLDRRQDILLNKVNIQFNGWLLTPKFYYFFYVWTNNSAQGQGAQVVVGGNLNYDFNKYVTVGGGIDPLPGVRSTEGNFPFWLTVDNRLMADEFFRPSYTMGVWAKGAIINKLRYQIMLGNNLSQLGIDAGQLDDDINTFSTALIWHPTTGEYGLRNNFGDFENHQKVATRVAAHFTRSDEDKQGVPASEAFENVTIRLSDGSVIFAPDLFGAGIQIENATYNMLSLDAGAKYKGFSLEGEFYSRRVTNLSGRGTETLNFDELLDNGFQLQASSMLMPQTLQLYGTYSKVFGEYGDPWDFRAGLNWFPWKNYVVRWNLEYIYASNSPIGGLSLPLPVGGNGSVFYSNFQVNF